MLTRPQGTAVIAMVVAIALALAMPPLLQWAHPLSGWVRVPLVVLALTAMTAAALLAGIAWQEYRIARIVTRKEGGDQTA